MKKILDWPLIFSLLGLAFFSLFNLLGVKKTLLFNQLIYFLIGFLFLFLFFRIGLRFFRLNSQVFYGLAVFFLLLSLIFGEEIRGSRRWLDLFLFRFQPSEFLKVFFIIALSDFFSQNINYKKILVSVVVFLLPIVVVFKQPDLGSALVYLSIYISILFFAGAPKRYFIYSLLGILITAPLVWHGLADYQKNRVVGFVNPSVDPAGISYNLIQSVITVGSGGFFGRGLGRGTQSRFLFLPENTTDFAFASLVEQFGFMGGGIVILLYGIIIYCLLKKLTMNAKNRFQFLYLVGLLTGLTVHIFINIGMNLGLMPVAGIPLPLISYGGSSIVTTMMLLGLANSL